MAREDRQTRFRRLRAFDHDSDPTAWGAGRLAGVDEAGVGPLAGPVVAAAVILPPDFELAELYDSKRMRAAERVRCARLIRTHCIALAVSRITPACIDRINILNAMLRAHCRALERLGVRPLTVLVDGSRAPQLPPDWRARLRTVVRGDGLSLAIAAASVVAKTTRDRCMLRLERRYPGYGFARHKGYATADHRRALRRLGMSPVHRRSFCGFLEAEALRARQMELPWDGVSPQHGPLVALASGDRDRRPSR